MNELWIVAGPTASGKTAQALALAERFDGEIVNADSQQVYRYFDIGTAKPSSADLTRVKHHLVSAIDPNELCSAARFQKMADDAIADIHRRGKRAIIVGGTGLYLRVLLHGVVEMPPQNLELRRQLEAEAAERGPEVLHQRLAEVDPVSAQRIPPRDKVRIVRALEIHSLTGKPASVLQQAHAFVPDRYPYQLWVLDPPRPTLYAAINHRTEALFRAGLVDEVRTLVARGFRNAAPMGSVGYAQALAVVEGALTEAEAIAQTAQETRRYAKRQLTWFRKERGAQFVGTQIPLLVDTSE